MNAEQRSLLIRDLLKVVLGPSLIAFGISAQDMPQYISALSVLIGGLITVGMTAFSQWKTRDEGLVQMAARVPSEAINNSLTMSAAVVATAAKVTDTTVVTIPEVAAVTPNNVLSTSDVKVVDKGSQE
tara:strand:- start:659 stop:1042 length:384 start_codon:yes stop_codon:yes gene_type:complete